MVEIEVVYSGGLQTKARHGPTGALLDTDAPRDNEGEGAGFSPTDLLAASLASCMLTVMAIIARRHGWLLDGARVRVEKHMTNDPVRRIGRLPVTFHLPESLPLEARPVLERTALSCPVHRSLHPDVEIPVTFHYGPAQGGSRE